MSVWALSGGVILVLDTVESTSTLESVSANVDTILARVDVAVSTRLATSGYTAPDNTSVATILTRTDVATSTRLAGASYTAPDNASVTAIKAKTDNLAFTAAGHVDANARYIKDTAITGSGTSGDPWGP